MSTSETTSEFISEAKAVVEFMYNKQILVQNTESTTKNNINDKNGTIWSKKAML